MNRRSFLAIGGGAAALTLMGGLLPIMARGADRRLDIRYVVTDRRHPESLQYGQVLAANGSIRLEVTDGLTKLWQETLAPLWREPGGAVAGLTSREIWTCLTEQARSQARQSVLTGQHAHLIRSPSHSLISWIIV